MIVSLGKMQTESEPGRSCQPSSASGMWSQSSSLIYTWGPWEQWCGRILQKGHLKASEEMASVQGSLPPRTCVLSVQEQVMPELPQGHGLDLGLVGDSGPRKSWNGQVSL